MPGYFIERTEGGAHKDCIGRMGLASRVGRKKSAERKGEEKSKESSGKPDGGKISGDEYAA